MITVYILNTNSVQSWLPISLVFWPNLKFEISPKRLFLKEIMAQYTEPFFYITEHPEEADFFAIPFEYFFVEKYNPDYLTRVYDAAKKTGKKVLLFDYTDYSDRTPKLPSHAILFRVATYKHHKLKNEIIMPYFVEDLGTRYAICPKEKGIPLVVGYCGQTRFLNNFIKVKAVIKRIAYSLVLYSKHDVQPKTHVRGIFWRNIALQALRAGGITSQIIERSFYSLHSFGVSLNQNEIRKDYMENLRECDLALCIRGDANASQRFYETLSASRIPLFLDTDCVLPLEEIISYDDFIIRVSANNAAHISEYVHSFETKCSSAQFLEKECHAREAYEKYLRIDRFFSLVFNRGKSPYQGLLFAS